MAGYRLMRFALTTAASECGVRLGATHIGCSS